ncbi:DUF2252 domain-containing protein [Arthrobacter sp. I2-34]|uniref:DUF2252 domain-containing protein n=1 Tax=Arthrobacter hankyongi TaxID=2904801 RepID=A0ABS9L471_9MICC|nr:DUF2252 domain-containing protein [Arthrobacter hankyongi]MCG2621477.1 DUF2252 domain-containing protein [Arthrobacter hankyongi]
MPAAPNTIALDRAAGKAARQMLPRTAHAEFRVPERDAVGVIEEQDTAREAELVPVRIGRMLQSPFAFYRGSAAVMAGDLAAAPVTGHRVVTCGDAHVANFGFYASPERQLVFDLNDFDEAFPAPWEWDIKRLAASAWLNGRNNSHSEDQCRTATAAAVQAYRENLRRLYEMTATERYFHQVEVEPATIAALDAHTARIVARTVAKARQRTSEQLLGKLTVTTIEGETRIVDQPPVIRHADAWDLEQVESLYVRRYRDTLRADTAVLLDQYRLVDYALRIVGVGSVGTRCWILLLLGPAGEPLFLQAKEAGHSVLETHGKVTGTPRPVLEALTTRGQGFRVVSAQRILQAQSDPFLGWVADVTGTDGRKRDFYIRQFRDMKGAFQLEELTAGDTARYASLCGRLLARAHAQSPGSAYISGYLGSSDAFDQAVATWAGRYADQTEKDYEALGLAVRSGRLAAETGV